jgi:predicted alpha-1,6-mannanase (GH76 family)
VTDAGVNWSERAAIAERAIVRRHLRPMAGSFGVAVARERWPGQLVPRAWPWHLWWQAQFLECLVEAQMRSPTSGRAATIAALVRGLRLANLGVWSNRRTGDLAWLGVALHRAGTLSGSWGASGVGTISGHLYRGWSEDGGGGLWGRRGSSGGVKNAHVNGPAAILMARVGQIEFAGSIVDWMADTLLDPDSGLLRDGVRVEPGGTLRGLGSAVHASCQGSYLGACVELAHRDDHQRWGDRAVAIVDALIQRLVRPDGILPGGGGGDGGLYAGILARYLTDAALRRTELETAAARMVEVSAEEVWAGRMEYSGGPVFSAEWALPALAPRRRAPEAQLSVQLSAWILLESVARLQRAGSI